VQITQLDLENVKSYRQDSITFTRGTNAICGANGAGKSTLLEAIGFALFDELACTQEQFVREGDKVATVTVHLVDEDERSYQVVRKCGSYGQHYVYDPELDVKLADGKEETMAWLYTFLGVEETGDLSVLFRDAVGVPQGLLTAAFLDTPSHRKNVFNPLLRVDEYERVWSALREPGRYLQDRIHEADTRIAGLEAEAKALPDWRDKAASLDEGISAGQVRRAALLVDLEDVTGRVQALEAVKGRLEALDRQVAEADGALEAIQGRLDDARAAVARAEAARQVVRETGPGHRAYLQAQERLRELEVQRDARDALREDLQGRRSDLRLARANLERLVGELQAIAAAEAEMEQLRPQVEEQARLEKALEEARLEAERLAMAEQRLAHERERLAELEQRLSSAQAGLQERNVVEEEIAPLQEEVDVLEERYSALSTRHAARQAELEQLDGQATRARERLAAAQQALSREEEELADLERRLSEVEGGLAERSQVEGEIEAQRQALQAAEDACRELEAQAVACRVALEQNQAQIELLETTEAAECPICHEPLTAEHRAELLAEHRACQADLDAALAEVHSRQEDAEAARAQQRKALDGLDKALQALPRASDREQLAARLEGQRAQVAERQEAASSAQCEVSANETRQEELIKCLSELQARRAEIDEERGEKRRILDALQERLRTMPREEEVTSLAADVSRQRETVTEGMQDVSARSGAPQEVRRLQGELDRVCDPRSAYRIAADMAGKRSEVERQRQETEAGIADLETQAAALDEQLSAYADLDALLVRERARQAEHEPAHQRYLEHSREAEALEERQAKAAALGQELQAAQGTYEQLVEERDRVAGTYDPEAYARLVERHGALSAERATLDERLRLQQEQLAGARAEVTRLEKVQADLSASRAERDELQEVQALLGYLRQVLRDAGPKITQALVEVVSLQAARLYADIMADHSNRLRWTDDYEILLSASGRDRAFRQLSGGEQMAAALSVRLALLREVSDIDVAFFDEPTANLDEARRDNLAEQIMNVKGFSQLFVISHDETFERDTDNVVHVVKENGASRACPESGERVEA
jgi:exonuclease SbcC